MKNKGPSTDPCPTPRFIGRKSDTIPPKLTA